MHGLIEIIVGLGLSPGCCRCYGHPRFHHARSYLLNAFAFVF